MMLDGIERARNTTAGRMAGEVYYSRSDDRGTTWSADTKLADSSCECCRIALASDSR